MARPLREVGVWLRAPRRLAWATSATQAVLSDSLKAHEERGIELAEAVSGCADVLHLCGEILLGAKGDAQLRAAFGEAVFSCAEEIETEVDDINATVIESAMASKH